MPYTPPSQATLATERRHSQAPVTNIMHQIFSEICAERVFKLSLEHNVFNELILIRVKEECKQLLQHYILKASLKMWADPVPKCSVALIILISLH